MRLFAHLNINNPLVSWEVAIGRIQSPREISPDGIDISLWEFANLKSYVEGKRLDCFRDELRLEAVRQATFPGQVSRLDGLYFFLSNEDAATALQRWNVLHSLEMISEVEFTPSNITQVDSEWITSNLGRSFDGEWMEKYWSGEVAGERPLTEVLAVGRGFIRNHDLRTKAYRRILELWPTTTPLLASACCAFQYREMDNISVMKPALFRVPGGIHGDHMIYQADFDNRQSEVVAAVEECQRDGVFPPIVIPDDGKTFFTIPDLRPWAFDIFDAELLASFDAIRGNFIPGLRERDA